MLFPYACGTRSPPCEDRTHRNMARKNRSLARIAFVSPRYGPGVVGGSESVIAEAARGFAARGYDVEVLTTCARSHFSWANEFEPGTFVDRGVTVRRFKTVTGAGLRSRFGLDQRVQRGERLDSGEEVAWANDRFRVPELYLHLFEHARGYDAIVLSPYLFWSTIYGAEVAPERSVIMPCLHDEPYARLGIVERDARVGGRLVVPLRTRASARAPTRSRIISLATRLSARPSRSPITTTPLASENGTGWARRSSCSPAGENPARVGTRCCAPSRAVVATGDSPLDLVTTGVGEPEIPEGLADRVARPRLPGACRTGERVRSRRGARPAEPERELLAHVDGGLARRNSGDRDGGGRGRHLALRALWWRHHVRG